MDTQYKALRELSDGGGGRGGLTKKLIEEFSVRIPVNLEEQVAIASVFTDIDYEIEKLEKELNKYRWNQVWYDERTAHRAYSIGVRGE